MSQRQMAKLFSFSTAKFKHTFCSPNAFWTNFTQNCCYQRKTHFLACSTSWVKAFSQVYILITFIPLLILFISRTRRSVFPAVVTRTSANLLPTQAAIMIDDIIIVNLTIIYIYWISSHYNWYILNIHKWSVCYRLQFRHCYSLSHQDWYKIYVYSLSRL